jgi:hypothetical protein
MRKLVVGFILVACNGRDPGSDATKVCVPGQQIECACQTAVKGIQACKQDGSGYAPCDCTTGVDGAAGSAMSDASDGAGGTSGGGSDASDDASDSLDAAVDRFPDVHDVAEAEAPGPCTSGVRWTGGDAPSPLMSPGRPCLGSGCHTASSPTPLTLAGTLYPLGGEHDENDCNGLDSAMQAAAIAITDDNGNELFPRLQVNAAGNFWTIRTLPPSFRVKVYSQGREAAMNAPVTDGNCNDCHQATDFMGAKGRVVPKGP